MKQCVNPEVGIMLTGFQLGILDAGEAERFDAHLKDCECCRLEIAQSESAMSLLRKRRVDVLQALHSEGISFDSAKEKLLASYQQKKSSQEEYQPNIKGFFKNLFKKNLSISNHESSGAIITNWKWVLAPAGAIVVVLAISMMLFSHKTMTSEILSPPGNQIAGQSNHPGNPGHSSDGIIGKLFSFFKSASSATSDSNNYSPNNEIGIPGGSESTLTGDSPTSQTPDNLSSNGSQNSGTNNIQQRNSIQTNSPTADSEYTLRRLRLSKNGTSSSPTIPDSVEASKPGECIAAAIASRVKDVSDIAQKIKKFIAIRYDVNKDNTK